MRVFFSFDYSDSIMVLNVAALYKCISNLLTGLKRFKNVNFPDQFVFAVSKKADQNLI